MADRELDPATWARLASGVAKGEYNLLLGAGASMGALGGDGQPLPSGPGLTEELMTVFSVPELSGSSLGEVYDLVRESKSNEGLGRNAYLRKRFSACRPSWQGRLSRFPWRRIWTLNIDDVVERAYWEVEPKRRRQSPTSVSWTERYRDSKGGSADLQVVHLHGYAPRLGVEDLSGGEDGGELVFSIVEYLRAATSKHAWHKVFGDLFQSEPFIVVGAKLHDEIDLAECLRAGNSSEAALGLPSLLVLLDLEQPRVARFANAGLRAHLAPAANFFERLELEVRAAERDLEKTFPGRFGHAKIDPRAISFLNQFRKLDRTTAQDAAPASSDHDFFSGDEPVWSDIVSDKPAALSIVHEVASQTMADLDSEAATIRLISGPSGSGKTTALLSVGNHLRIAGNSVFLFRGEEAPDAKAVLWWLAQSGRTILLVDDFGDFAPHFSTLLAEANEQKVRLHILGAERSTRDQSISQSFSVAQLPESRKHTLDRLTDDDIRRFLDVLQREFRLGLITRWPSEQQFDFIKTDCSGNILHCLLKLDNPAALAEKLTSEVENDLKTEHDKDLYVAVCLSHSLGYSLSVGLASSAVGGTAPQIVESVHNGPLKGLVRLSQDGMRARHRVRAALTVERAVRRDRLWRVSQALARSLSPHLSPNAIRSRTKSYRLARMLMHSKVVQGWFENDAPKWYDALADEFGWNARYWEQRALTEADLGRFDKARSFAERAVLIRKDAFSLTTLGTIVARAATDLPNLSPAERRSRFWEAVTLLRAALELGQAGDSGGGRQHPFTTFFAYAQRFAERMVDEGAPRDGALFDEWQRWYREAKLSPAFEHAGDMLLLETIHHRWLAKAFAFGGAEPSKRDDLTP